VIKIFKECLISFLKVYELDPAILAECETSHEPKLEVIQERYPSINV
jgi:hypothetical protein